MKKAFVFIAVFAGVTVFWGQLNAAEIRKDESADEENALCDQERQARWVSEEEKIAVRVKIAEATSKLYSKILNELPQSRDFVLSPLSIFRVVWGDYLVSIDAEERQSLLETVGLGDIEVGVLRKVVEEMTHDHKPLYKSVSAILYRDPLNQKFLPFPETLLIPLSQAVEKQINRIVERQTEGFLQSPFEPGEIYDPMLRAVFMNILFFKGSWEVPFARVYEDVITLASGEKVQAKVMSKFSEEDVLREPQGDWVFLPYRSKKGRCMSVIYVPHNIVDKEHLLSAAKRLPKILSYYQERDKVIRSPVDFVYPMIEAHTKVTDLLSILNKSGVSLKAPLIEAFDAETVLSKLVQVSRLRDDREGSTGAAVTVGGITRTSFDEPFRLKIDCRKPCIRFLVGPDGEILFANTSGLSADFFVK